MSGEPGLGPPDHGHPAGGGATGDPGLGPPEGVHAAAAAETVGERVRPTGAKVWTLLDEATLRARVVELGGALRADYEGLEPILVSVLRGAVVFLADLVRAAEMPCKVDFMAVQRSDATDQTGVVRILKDLGLDVTGEHVLLVEDVVDTGRTLAYLLEVLETRRPASLRVCALLDRRARRVVDVPLAHVGFEIPDSFVFGYGLDLDERERGRNQVLATTDPQALRRDLGTLQIPER
jgi:hypoxanthine phosphoribosyltransferase